MGDKAIIKVSIGKTIGLPNYSSARVDVGIEIPASLDLDERQVQWEAAWAEVENQYKLEMQKLFPEQGKAPPPPPPPRR